jgi:hypothetical protein
MVFKCRLFNRERNVVLKPSRLIQAGIVSLTVFACSQAFATSRDQIKSCPAVASTDTLSNGQKVELPLCADNTTFVSVASFGDLNEANRLLAPAGLYAVPMNGKALIILAALNYQQTTLGPYREFIFGAFASKTPDLHDGWLKYLQLSDLLSPFEPPKTQALSVIKIWVDQELALQAGNEIWGFNKSMGTINLSETTGFSLSDANGNLIVENPWKSEPGLYVPAGQDLDFYTVPTSGTWAASRYEGNARFGHVAKDETLTTGSNEWGSELSKLGLSPLFKESVSGLKLQIGAPQEAASIH